VIKAMLADTPLVKNLSNPEYLKIILNGHDTLEQRFAEIDEKVVRQKMKKKRKSSRNICENEKSTEKA
jgi:hypothetical protein